MSAGTRAVRAGGLSLRLSPRPLACGVAGLGLLVLVAAASMTLGDYPLPLPRVLAVLAGGGDEIDRTVVTRIRAGRAVVAAAVGAALGLAGALTQSVARNPLASPDILGVPQGAALAAVAAIVLGGPGIAAAFGGLGLVGAALAGAIASGAAVWLLAGVGRSGMTQVVLIGVGASVFLSGLTTWLLAIASLDQAAEARLWLTGSLAGRDWDQAWPPLAALAAVVACAGWLARQLEGLALGEDVAHSLGVPVRVAQAAQLLAAVALTALAVSAAGPIGFIAFVVPQLARLAAGLPAPPLLLSAILGALLLSAADLAARALLPWELPVGVVTVLAGAPALLAVVVHVHRKATR
ncbi:FecCD family ABC transporter permease [Corynebacterium sp. 335C]